MIPIIVLGLCANPLLAGCSKGPTTDEAWRVGYDMGIADECRKEGERIEPLRSAYDDSTGANKLNSAFQTGY